MCCTAVLAMVMLFGPMKVLADEWNVGILIFLVMLGAMVSLMNKAGGSAAFGEWAAKRIKTKVGAQLATVLLGVLIFVDDYFNCLTVGSVMRPVTDKHKVSREKLAYLIDATAAQQDLCHSCLQLFLLLRVCLHLQPVQAGEPSVF